MTATFDVKMRVTARDPGRSMQFTAVGRSVRGAAGNVRASHLVRLSGEGEGSTRVLLEGDVALGGMLGSVGQKVVAKQAAAVTRSFAQALQARLGGGAPGVEAPTDAAAPGGSPAAQSPSAAAGPSASPPPSAAADSSAAPPPSAAADPNAAPPLSAAGGPSAGPGGAPPPAPPAPSAGRGTAVRGVIAGAIVLALLLALRRLRSR
jgi:type II secretory pathway pseudopilin PulG